MKRRDFLRRVGGAGGALAAGTVLTACDNAGSGSAKAESGSAPAVNTNKTRQWTMVTTWPKNFPGLGTAAEHLAELIDSMSGGRLKVQVKGAGEMLGLDPFQIANEGVAVLGVAPTAAEVVELRYVRRDALVDRHEEVNRVAD